jgi:hypothetical protein
MAAKFLFALFWLFSTAIGKWLPDHFAYDWFVHFLEDKFAIKETDLIASASSVFIPAILIGASFFAVYRLGAKQRQIATIPAYHGLALSLPTMSITEIAAYLRDKSAWGWRERRRVTLRQFVQGSVPDELRRAARNGKVRFIGTLPNAADAIEVNIGYWDHATFDDSRIWDSRNEFFTTSYGISTGVANKRILHLRFGRAPREEVMTEWPVASLSLQWYIRAIIWFRRARYRFPYTLQE